MNVWIAYSNLCMKIYLNMQSLIMLIENLKAKCVCLHNNEPKNNLKFVLIISCKDFMFWEITHLQFLHHYCCCFVLYINKRNDVMYTSLSAISMVSNWHHWILFVVIRRELCLWNLFHFKHDKFQLYKSHFQRK